MKKFLVIQTASIGDVILATAVAEKLHAYFPDSQIDMMIKSGDTSWEKKGDSYIFNNVWGKGLPAPKGEDEAEDRFFSLIIIRGEKRGEIRHGIW